ncbi:MAG: glycoside hydrolase family 28 protein, partial [Acidobacteriota bacterium]|nr:glycoside hydrolase family 28 protein [Acidobacteriota bacterium]
ADTARIQQAIESCPKGQAVELRADGDHDAFLSGPLQLRAGVTLVVGARAILFGSRKPRDYDLTPASCGIVSEKGHGCKAVISGDHVRDAGVMGEGTIDGRGWAKITGQNVTWWDLAEQARKGGNQSCPRLIVLSHCDNFTLYRITMKNSANFNVSYSAGNGFTAWGVIIDTPKNARNTDGIDPGASTNVTITHCFIHTGDDNVAIKAGGPTSHMTISHNHFYTGHGMSIGSETNGGAGTIRVSDLSIDGADNGLRIKSNSSRGGLVRDVVYSDVCIRDTKNPILMDSNYSYFGKDRDKLPVFEDIVLRDVRVLTPGKITLQGYDEKHRLKMTFDNVHLDALSASKISATHADLTLGPGPVNFRPSGEDVHLHADTGGSPETAEPNACEGKFVPFPER